MARRGKENDHTKSGLLRRRGQYRIQHEMMMMIRVLEAAFLRMQKVLTQNFTPTSDWFTVLRILDFFSFY